MSMMELGTASRPIDLADMLDLHVRMQFGCYVSGVDAAPDGGRLIWSDRIADHGLNIAFGTRDGQWIRQAAAQRQRSPVLLAENLDVARTVCLALRGTPVGALAWMTRPATIDGVSLADGRTIVGTDGPVPDEAFLSVFAGLSSSRAANAATIEAYGPALAGATAGQGVTVRHLTMLEHGDAVASASLYLVGGIAGLYNIGVVAERQRTGLGRRITEQAIAAAADLGCSSLLLQCVSGSHAERLYAALGFERRARPILVALR